MQKIKSYILLFLAVIASSYIFGQDSLNLPNGAVLGLRQAVDIAINKNLLVRQAGLANQTSKVNYQQSIEYMLPQIYANATQNANFGRSLNQNTYSYTDQQFNQFYYGVNANLTLFQGLQIQNGIRQNALLLEASKMDWQQQKDVITLNVILAYLQVLSNQDILTITREQADVDLKQVERLEVLKKEGAIPLLSTYYDLKGRYAADLVAIANGVNALEASKVNLFQLLNVPYRRDISYERIPLDLLRPEYGSSSDSIYQIAVNSLPVIKSVDLKAKAFQKALSVARGAYYPTLSAGAYLSSNYSSVAQTQTPSNIFSDTSKSSYVTVSNSNYPVISNVQGFNFNNTPFWDQLTNNRYQQVGLQLYVPILNFFRARNGVKKAKIDLQNAKNNAEAARNTLQQNVEVAYQNMINAYESYKGYREQTTALSESFRGAEIRFNEGAITSVDYLVTKNAYDQANTNFIASKYNYIFRTKILDYYQGKLSW
jgi:outer membrane protein